MIDCNDSENSVISFMRRGYTPDDDVIVVCNFTPQTHFDYMVGVPQQGLYSELLNTDERQFGGTHQTNTAPLETFDMPYQGQPYAIRLTAPPLGVVFLKRQAK
jgi:1,4-alpha-glucan branching enzyme